ncbi:MAG TPA: DUF2254 family protein, partial [Acidimicrobiia bacterium]|nr:DUF2254 family protein [Acidimicrobiia bacterium]
QLASSNFSPRTLPGFLRDRSQQIAIGTVTATFAYSLLVLREVRVLSEDAPENVPNIAVATAVVLAIASLLAIIHAIDHTARSLKVERVANEAMRATIRPSGASSTTRPDRRAPPR